jgi:hypothetical protein
MKGRVLLYAVAGGVGGCVGSFTTLNILIIHCQTSLLRKSHQSSLKNPPCRAMARCGPSAGLFSPTAPIDVR